MTKIAVLIVTTLLTLAPLSVAEPPSLPTPTGLHVVKPVVQAATVPPASPSAPIIWERANGEICVQYPAARCVICVDAEFHVTWRNTLLLEMPPESCLRPIP